MKLENRVTELEKIVTSQSLSKDIREGLEYNRRWNYYMNKDTGENFCSACIGTGKKIPVAMYKDSSGEGWNCQHCKASRWEDQDTEDNSVSEEGDPQSYGL